MTYEARLTVNYAFGALTNAAAVTDTNLVSADFATRIPTGLSTTTYVPITLQDPATGAFEVVWANAHAAASNTITCLRGREGTTSQNWPSSTLWTVSPTLRDGLLPVANRAALPVDPHVGMRANLQDSNTAAEFGLGSGWAGPGRVIAGRQVITAGTFQATVTAEVTLTKLNVTGLRTYSGTWYQMAGTIQGQASTANDSFYVRVRKDTPLTGTVVALGILVIDVGAFTHQINFSSPWKATVDNAATAFYVSLGRAGGTGYFDVVGDRATNFWITELPADASVWSEVA